MGLFSSSEMKIHPSARLRPLNPSVPMPLLLPNLENLWWGLSAWISLSHGWSCHCMFITHPAWPWEHAWIQDMTGDTHSHTVINTVYTTVFQVHQLASNNDLIPPGVSWRARRSRTYCTNRWWPTISYWARHEAKATCMFLYDAAH